MMNVSPSVGIRIDCVLIGVDDFLFGTCTFTNMQRCCAIITLSTVHEGILHLLHNTLNQISILYLQFSRTHNSFDEYLLK